MDKLASMRAFTKVVQHNSFAAAARDLRLSRSAVSKYVIELEEELGIATEEACLAPAAFASADNQGRHMLLLLYICRTWRGTPEPLDAAALTWVRPAQMFALDMPPADSPLIGLLDALI